MARPCQLPIPLPSPPLNKALWQLRGSYVWELRMAATYGSRVAATAAVRSASTYTPWACRPRVPASAGCCMQGCWRPALYWPCPACLPCFPPPATVAMTPTTAVSLGSQAWNACFSWVLHAGLLASLLRAMALPASVPWLDLFAYTGYAYVPACAIIVAGVLAGGRRWRAGYVQAGCTDGLRQGGLRAL